MKRLISNWLDGYYYNVPVDELISIIDNAINNGYSITWDGDTGKDNFYKAGYAVIPVDEDKEIKDEEDQDEENIPEREVEK